MGLSGAGLKRARPSTEIRPRLRSGRAYTAPQRATKLEALRRADAYETGSGQGPRLVTLGNGGMISFGVNRTIVKPPWGEVVPRRIRRRVLTCRRSSVTGRLIDRRSPTPRSTITFTRRTPRNDPPRRSQSVPLLR